MDPENVSWRFWRMNDASQVQSRMLINENIFATQNLRERFCNEHAFTVGDSHREMDMNITYDIEVYGES